jgi:hypothetical protein
MLLNDNTSFPAAAALHPRKAAVLSIIITLKTVMMMVIVLLLLMIRGFAFVCGLTLKFHSTLIIKIGKKIHLHNEKSQIHKARILMNENLCDFGCCAFMSEYKFNENQ